MQERVVGRKSDPLENIEAAPLPFSAQRAFVSFPGLGELRSDPECGIE